MQNALKNKLCIFGNIAIFVLILIIKKIEIIHGIFISKSYRAGAIVTHGLRVRCASLLIKYLSKVVQNLHTPTFGFIVTVISDVIQIINMNFQRDGILRFILCRKKFYSISLKILLEVEER